MASIYYPGCSTDELPFYVCDPCADYEKGKVRSTALVTTSYYATLLANPTDPEVWQTGIESEDIIIIPKVIGALDTPDPETGPGYGDDVETDTSRLYTLTWRDPNYKQNCNFYNTLSKKSGFYHAIYRTGSQTHISTKAVTLRTSAPITETDTDNVEWNASARWRDLEQPCPFDTPTGIFECFALQD